MLRKQPQRVYDDSDVTSAHAPIDAARQSTDMMANCRRREISLSLHRDYPRFHPFVVNRAQTCSANALDDNRETASVRDRNMLNSEIGAGRIFDRSELALASTEFLWNDACIKQRFQSLYVLIAFGFGRKCQIQRTLQHVLTTNNVFPRSFALTLGSHSLNSRPRPKVLCSEWESHFLEWQKALSGPPGRQCDGMNILYLLDLLEAGVGIEPAYTALQAAA